MASGNFYPGRNIEFCGTYTYPGGAGFTTGYCEPVPKQVWDGAHPCWDAFTGLCVYIKSSSNQIKSSVTYDPKSSFYDTSPEQRQHINSKNAHKQIVTTGLDETPQMTTGRHTIGQGTRDEYTTNGGQ